MLISVEGIYRDGKIELSELPSEVRDEMRVIVTFVEPHSPSRVSLAERGIEEARAAKLRDSLSAFAEDWESPEMEVYDHYDAARTRSL